jgi:predicted metal-dependent hydrolase
MPTSPDDCSVPLHPAALRGLELFNAGEYFEAHEALEDAWRDETGPVRLLYQGILQVAVTYLHVQHDNYEGALKLSARAGAKLAAWPATCRGIDIASLRANLATVIASVEQLGPSRLHSFNPLLFKKVSYLAPQDE